MSDTYNENEIVKCKHLTEFARQLNIKLDGGIDPKLDRTLTLKIQNAQTGTTANVPLDLSQDTFDIPLSYIQASSTSTAMSLGTPTNDTSRLFLSNLTGASLQWNQLTYNTTYTSFSWRFTYEQITEPFTVSFTLNLPENDTCKEWQKNITLNFR